MRTISRFLSAAAVLTVLALPGFSSPVYDYSWISQTLFPGYATGSTVVPNFVSDNDVFLAHFTVTGNELVTIRTLGYGGGTNLAGVNVPAGGFATVLSVFDSTGLAVASPFVSPGITDAAGCAPNSLVGSDPFTYCGDVYTQIFLTQGTYTVALAQISNQANTDHLVGGFAYSPNITSYSGDGVYADSGFGADPAYSNGFTDQYSGNQTTSAYALDISIAPEPGTIILTGAGLLLAGIGARKRRLNAR